jgi:hypothetical protein
MNACGAEENMPRYSSVHATPIFWVYYVPGAINVNEH